MSSDATVIKAQERIARGMRAMEASQGRVETAKFLGAETGIRDAEQTLESDAREVEEARAALHQVQKDLRLTATEDYAEQLFAAITQHVEKIVAQRIAEALDDASHATPQHEWNGSQIRFQSGPDTWGPWVDLRGPAGPAAGFSLKTLTQRINLDGGDAADFGAALDGGGAGGAHPSGPGFGGGGAGSAYDRTDINAGRAY